MHLEFSCRDGRCGVCKVGVLKGSAAELVSPALPDNVELNQNEILTCCHGATSDLFLNAENLFQLKDVKTKILPCRIDSLEHLSCDVLRVFLRLPPNSAFNYLAGQYVDVIGPDAVRRSYSLASAPKTGEFKLELIIRKYQGGLMSKYWFEEAKVNDLLRLEGPLGSFFIRENETNEVAFLATGTGIAPVIAMIEDLMVSGKEKKFKKLVCYFGCRNEREIFFDANEIFQGMVRFVPVFSREAAPGARKGYIQEALVEDFETLDQLSVYACGSPDMIHSARTLLIDNGLQENKFYSDAFLASSN